MAKKEKPAPSEGKKQAKPRRLTLKQQAFVANYTNSENAETYGNGRQSVLAIPAVKKRTPGGASVQAHMYLSNANLISQIEERATKAGLTDTFRFKTLKSIAAGQYVRTVTRDPDTGETRETPKASEVVKAIDVVNKMTGVYDRNRSMANATSVRFRELARALKPKLINVTPAKTRRIGVDAVHKSRQVKVNPEHRLSMAYWPIDTSDDSEPTLDAVDQEQLQA